MGAVLLGVAEVFTLDLTLLMCSGGALAGGLAALLGAPWWLASVIASVAALLLLFALRPFLLKSLRERTPLVETNAVPSSARRRPSSRRSPSARVASSWAARCGGARTEEGAEPIEADVHVTVVRIRGAIAIVEKK